MKKHKKKGGRLVMYVRELSDHFIDGIRHYDIDAEEIAELATKKKITHYYLLSEGDTIFDYEGPSAFREGGCCIIPQLQDKNTM